ncbi:Protein lsm14 [Clonorchis sinensis]|uniref:Protein lsm14 n=1 Tax=Clonorchis sinensis TaxID=79923 RepID=A0A8T1MIM6_CLOSI|nr:Protein lsm14 [Clonorchis sinensis]
MEAIYENCVKIKSRAGIEYTGLLHSIDTEHSTVTLKRVHLSDSLTEGPVNIRSNSFDYVIFRGGDIEDVQLSFKVRRTITPAHDDAIVRVNSRPFIMNTGYNCWATSGNLRHDPAIVRIDQKANADVSFPAEKNTIDVTSVSENDDRQSQPGKSSTEFKRKAVPQRRRSARPGRSRSNLGYSVRSLKLCTSERRCQSAEGGLSFSASQQSVHTQCSGDTVNNDDTQRMKENIPNTTDQMRVYDKQHSFFDRLSSGIEGSRPASKHMSPSMDTRSKTNEHQLFPGRSSRRICYHLYPQEGFGLQPNDTYSLPYYSSVHSQTHPNIHPAYQFQYTAPYSYRQQLSLFNAPYFINWQHDYNPVRYTIV